MTKTCLHCENPNIQALINQKFSCTRFRARKTVLGARRNRARERTDIHVTNNNMIQR